MSGEERSKEEKLKTIKEWFRSNKIIRILLIVVLFFVYYITSSEQHYENMLLNSIVLTLNTALITDLLINFNYEKRLKDSLYDILINPKLMEKFIDLKYKREIMCVAMRVNLGDNITKALYNNILDNYLHTYNKILREDFHFNIYLEESKYERFYSADMQIVFHLPRHDEELELDVIAFEEQSEIQEKMNKVTGLNKQLIFPLILAKNVDEISVKDKFNVDIRVDGTSVTKFLVDESLEKKIKIEQTDKARYVRIQIRTLLNKDENFFQEDIFCIHKGYNLTFGYETGLLKGCKCYHSCKSSGLVTLQNKNSINIHTDDILLPENNFVFIWEKQYEQVGFSKNQ